MSTRCNIVIKESDQKVILYHHCDGYPEGVGQDLKNFLKEKTYWHGSQIATELVKRIEPDFEYEISFDIHGDIDYLYEIDCSEKTLKCYKVEYEVETGEQEKSLVNNF